MVRSSKSDTIDKFRFKVDFFNFSYANLDNFQADDDNSIRAGFSEVVLPKINIGERLYRENIDPNKYTKAAGLVTYEPVTFRRGKAENNRQLYEWYKLVNDEASGLSVASSALTSIGTTPGLNPLYRKEVVIQLLSREGRTVRAWMLFNAFPISYKGGNDLNSVDETKVLEELTITYESVMELNDDSLATINKEIQESTKLQAIVAALTLASQI